MASSANPKNFHSIMMLITLFILVVLCFSFYSTSIFDRSKQMQVFIYSDHSGGIPSKVVANQLGNERLRRSEHDASEKSEFFHSNGSEQDRPHHESECREKVSLMDDSTKAREGEISLESTTGHRQDAWMMPSSLDHPPGGRKEIKEELANCKGRFVYIYELPAEFNEDLLDKCGRLSGTWEAMCGNLENHGYGPLLTNSSQNRHNYTTIASDSPSPHSWFKTEQFSLDVIFHQRMLKSYPCLTHNPSLAQLFFIPFYSALDSAFTIFSPQLHLRDRLVQRLIGWLGGNPTWNEFKDTRRHFIVLGKVTWDFSRDLDSIDGWGSSFLAQPELFHVTKLLIERKSWSKHEISIPYPTSFHPSSNQDIELWLRKVRRSQRKLLFSFIGSKSRGNQWSKDLRVELGKQCEKAGNKSCIQATCGTHNTAMNTIDCVKHPEHVTTLFLRSIFCLQPPGDSPTRKSLFDSLITGCIPVFFSTSSAYDQYTWHLPRNGSIYSIFFYGDDVINGHVDLTTILATIAKDIPRLRQMQREIISMIPHLVYAWPHHNITNSAFRDAVDITIDNLLLDVPV